MVVERYKHEQLLGQGMMSDVWLVKDSMTNENVVLKIMTAVTEDDRRDHKARERFMREIDITRSLQHPHILPIIDFGEMRYHGRTVPYYVSPFISDGSLAEVIKREPPWKYWSLEQTGDAILQAAESLWYLHTRDPKIVHEDVKPANFLCQAVQSPHRAAYLYLCDFGISRWQKSAHMIASEVMGTFAYMAPEQAEGNVDSASDQYALAVMACYLLTGKLPIQGGTNREYIEAHLNEIPFTPSQLNPERIQSQWIDDIILQALAKDPDDRFATILEFAQTLLLALKEYEQGQPDVPIKRLETIAIVPVEPDEEKATPPVQMPLAPVVVVSSVATSPSIAPVKEREPQKSASEQAAIFIDVLEIAEKHVLDEPLPAKPTKETVAPLQSHENILAPLAVEKLVAYELPARPRQLCWSPDGSIIAAVLYGRAPLCFSGSGVMQEVHVSEASNAACMSWSPDSRVLAISTPGQIQFWDVKAQAALPLTIATGNETVESMDWSMHGQLAVWIDNQIAVYDLANMSLMMRQPPLSRHVATGPMRPGNLGTLRWSPDGAFLAAGGANGMIVCWSMSHIAPAWHVIPAGQRVYGLCWSQDGTLLVASFRNNRVIGWNTSAKEEQFRWERLPSMPRTLTIAPSKHITIASSERRMLCGTHERNFPSYTLPGQLLAAWSPAYQDLATLDEQRQNVLVLWRQQ